MFKFLQTLPFWSRDCLNPDIVMALLPHYFQPGNWYFITTSAWKLHPVFLEKANADIVVKTLLNLRDKEYFEVDEFVIMPEHIHMIVAPKKKTAAEIMRDFKRSAARIINNNDGINSRKIWMDEYFDEQIWDEKDLNNKRMYIHYNPVKRGLVELPEEYLYSTANRQLRALFNLYQL